MMDAKEALKELEDLTVDYGDRNEEQIARLDEAIDMAMEALRNLPNRLRQATDTISRKAAIDAMKSISDSICEQQAIDALCELPSAQPEKRTEERTETHSCDCISRQAAIDAIFGEPLYDTGLKKRDADAVVPSIYEKIKSLPSAQSDQSKYEYHYDHTDCIWYRPKARNRCPVTCSQYRDGWNDAMNYIFRDGKGYRPYKRGERYEE